MTLLQSRSLLDHETELLARLGRPVWPALFVLPVDPRSSEPECECQDVERCPVHHGYED